MKADLHVHTTASDGRLSPSELVLLAASRGIGVLAITDHDSVEGIAPALKAANLVAGLKVIPGVEISTDVADGEVHILGYFIDYTSPSLIDVLKLLRDSRKERGRKMVARLASMGIVIDWERVKEIAQGGSIGRPHVALAMLERGYVPTVKEAFTRYIGRGGPAYVERTKITSEEAVALVRNSGGLPMLAHPAEIKNLPVLLEALKAEGLAGVEAYYDGYPAETVRRLALSAREHGLIICGGSDYHGLDDGNETLIGECGIPTESVSLFLAKAETLHAPLASER